MFVRDVALDSPGDAVTLAEFMKYSCQAKGTIEAVEEENWCSVPGCCIQFPPEPDSHARNGWSYTHERGRKKCLASKTLVLDTLQTIERFRYKKRFCCAGSIP